MLATQQHDHQNRLMTERRSVSDLKAEKAAMEERIGQLSRHLRHRMTTGLSTVVTIGWAGAAGVIDGYTEAKNWKLGPAKFTSVMGLAAVVTGLLVDDADAAEFASAVGRGLAVGQIYMGGRGVGLRYGEPGASTPPSSPPSPPGAGPLVAKK